MGGGHGECAFPLSAAAARPPGRRAILHMAHLVLLLVLSAVQLRSGCNKEAGIKLESQSNILQGTSPEQSLAACSALLTSTPNPHTCVNRAPGSLRTSSSTPGRSRQRVAT